MVGASITEALGEGNGGLSNTLSQKRQRSSDDGANRVDTESKRLGTLDLDILDCPICFEALTIPIFQCENGHLACSSCCPKLNNKCVECCRAMESVVESVLVSCSNAKFGCSKNISYGKKSSHEKECSFSPCSCPVKGCNYTGSYRKLYSHYITNHLAVKVKPHRFSIGTYFSVQMEISDEILVIREALKGLLFVVQCFRETYGVYVTISYIAPSAPEIVEFSYRLSYSVDGHNIKYESPQVKRIQKVSFQIPQENFLLIPHSLLLRGESLDVELTVTGRLR